MRRIFVFSIVILFIIGFSRCKSSSKDENKKSIENDVKMTKNNQNLNISILIDVSDRISPKIHPNETMEYYQRDLGYIGSITKSFETHLLNKRIILMNDKIQLFIEPTPKNSTINDIVSRLRISFDKSNVDKGKIKTINKSYSQLCSELYDLAIEDNKYVGSDIWGFFKNKVADYCISDKHRNILVILTDGYVYHKDNAITDGNKSSYLTSKKINQLGLKKSNWETIYESKNCGFIVPNKGFENLEVLILGVNTYNNSPYEIDVIRRYWSDWLKGMGIKKFDIKTADLPSNLDEVIQNYILN